MRGNHELQILPLSFKAPRYKTDLYQAIIFEIVSLSSMINEMRKGNIYQFWV